MIQPDGLLAHARHLAGTQRGRPPDADLRRGASAAYYAVFHDITDRAARHLIGSSGDEARNSIRRSWSHGELENVASMVSDRAKTLAVNPTASLPSTLHDYGPLVDIAASAPELVEALELFSDLQSLRHQADYDHGAAFDKLVLLTACQDAERARTLLASAPPAASEAVFTLLTVRRKDFRER